MPSSTKRIIISVIIVSTIVLLALFIYKATQTTQAPAHIFCLMVTGKDDARIEYARKSVANFLEQSHPHKTLVIINHHPTQSVLGASSQNNTFEFKVTKTPKTTLGQLRNISLQMVALNSYWTTWDDDDYRHPTYLATLAAHATPDTVVTFSKRLEYNKNNGKSWVCQFKHGMVMFLAPYDNRITYLDKDTREDANIQEDLRRYYKVRVLDNDPSLYVRLIHQNHTSIYVNPNRDYLMVGKNYSERYTTAAEQQYIQSILPRLLIHS